MYFITTKRMLEVCFSAHPNIQYRTEKFKDSFKTVYSCGDADSGADSVGNDFPQLHV